MNLLNRGTKLLRAVLFLALSATAYAQDQDGPACGNSSLKGAFGFQITGTNNFFGQFAFNGRFATDGNGNITSGSGTESIAGTVVHGVPFNGTYTVKADCTGTATIIFIRSDNQQQAHLDFALVNDGQEILFISRDQETTETGLAKKISIKRHDD
jgi:hypothetical protein